MFDTIQNNKNVIQVVLGLVVFSFMFFGVSTYSSLSSSAGAVAKVGDLEVNAVELKRLQEQQKMSESQALDRLVDAKLLLGLAQNEGLAASVSALRKEIESFPAFQKDNKFSHELYQKYLTERAGQTVVQFEQGLSEDMVRQQLVQNLFASDIQAKNLTNQVIQMVGTVRSVQQVRFPGSNYMAQVKVDDAAVEAYFKAHASDFKVPDRVQVDYLLLNHDELQAKQPVTEEEVQAYFKANQAALAKETRNARHILLALSPQAKPDEQAQVLAKAQDLLQKVKAQPDQFPALAKQYSQDPVSGAKGGELGFVEHNGQMVKPFEDALFQLKPNEISGLVKTEFGYHIIQLLAVKQRDLSELRPQIEGLLKNQKAAKAFDATKEQLTELTYNHPQTLKDAADKLGLTIQHSDWISKANPGSPLFSNPKLLDALFADDAVKSKNNTEVFDLGQGKALVARVSQFEAARNQSLAEVKGMIVNRLQQEAGLNLAKAEGEKQLKALQSNQNPSLVFEPARDVGVGQPMGIAEDVVSQIMKLPVKDLPLYAATVDKAANQYVIYKVLSEKSTLTDDAPNAKMIRVSLERSKGEVLLEAFKQNLLKKTKVLMYAKPKTAE